MTQINVDVNIDEMPKAKLYEFEGNTAITKENKIKEIEKCLDEGNREDAKWLFMLNMCDGCKTVCPTSLLDEYKKQELCSGCFRKAVEENNEQSNVQDMQNRDGNED